jgi:large subunit ribosomal protein L1
MSLVRRFSTAKKAAYVKFDESVELHLRMGVDVRNANQQVRGVALLPHGLGKQVRVLVFAREKPRGLPVMPEQTL